MSKPYRKSLLAILLPRLGASPPARSVKPTASAPKPMFHAVSIRGGSRCCEAAKHAGGRRFLARTAPALPLVGCSLQDQCQCRYVKHADRRSDPRRLTDFGVAALVFDAKERRFRKGRRKTD